MNLNLIAKVLIICLGLLEAVSSTPQPHTASDGQEYLIEVEQEFNWIQAWHECARRSYQLVEIDSVGKNTAIINILKTFTTPEGDLWLGGNDEFSSRQDSYRNFVWSATGKQLTFSDWSDKTPYHSARLQHCVYLMSKSCVYKWNDDVCTYKKGFICEINHFKKTYDEDLKHKCDEFRMIISSITSEFEEAQQQMISEINKKIQSIDNLKKEIEQLQTTAKTDIQNILVTTNENVANLVLSLRNRAVELNGILQGSTYDTSSTLSGKMNDADNLIHRLC